MTTVIPTTTGPVAVDATTAAPGLITFQAPGAFRPTANPMGCRWCGIGERQHGRQWTRDAGWHEWTQPTQEQIKARMQARRANR
jgi:hypothetical protein